MHTIPLADIVIPPDRQRQTFDPAAILELASSIKARGLFHAIQLRPDGKTLVSGERRLRAIREHLIPLGFPLVYNGQTLTSGIVPYVVASSDDPLVLEEIELDENLKRQDLTWKEHAEAVARLHALRGKQNPAQTVADTTREVFATEIAARPSGALGSLHDKVRESVLITPHLHRPEVAAAPDLKTAFKVLKKLEDGERNRALALMVGDTHNSGIHQIFHADCIDWMTHPQWIGKFDVILTDPPYGMGADTFGDGAGRLAQIDHEYDDSYLSWQLLMKAWCNLSYIVAKPQAHAYVWCDIDRFHELKALMQEAGWYVFRTPLTNFKQNSGRVPLPDKGPRRQSEWCLYAIKGGKLVNYIASDVIVTGSDEQLSHGAQKPVALFDDLLRRSVKPGDWVLDTFAGTGTILPAAHALKCKAVAVEHSETYYGICAQRLADLDTKQGELLS